MRSRVSLLIFFLVAAQSAQYALAQADESVAPGATSGGPGEINDNNQHPGENPRTPPPMTDEEANAAETARQTEIANQNAQRQMESQNNPQAPNFSEPGGNAGESASGAAGVPNGVSNNGSPNSGPPSYSNEQRAPAADQNSN